MNNYEIVTKKVENLEQLPTEIWLRIGDWVYDKYYYLTMAISVEEKLDKLKAHLDWYDWLDSMQAIEIIFNSAGNFEEARALLFEIHSKYLRGLKRYYRNWFHHMPPGERRTLTKGLHDIIVFRSGIQHLTMITLRYQERCHIHRLRPLD